MCKACAAGSGEDEDGSYLCACTSPALGPLQPWQGHSENFVLESPRCPRGFSSWCTARFASRRRNRLVRPGAFANRSNIFHLLQSREQASLSNRGVCLQPRNNGALERWVESASMSTAGRLRTMPTDEPTRSTISVAHSPDGKLVASTHGDHTVKIFKVGSGDLWKTLAGHRRTPWTVKFHPTDPMILASGCLGREARIWNLRDGQCEHLCYLHKEIVSLAFHPKHPWLILAAGRRVYFWNYETGADATCLMQMQRNVRCVGFTPSGNSMLVGVASSIGPPSAVHYINRREEITVQLQTFEFVANSVPQWLLTRNAHLSPVRPPKTIVSHAVLYNDGGFHISPCGTKLCAIVHEALSSRIEQNPLLSASDSSGSGENQDNRTPRPESNQQHLQDHLAQISRGGSNTSANSHAPGLASIAQRVDSLNLKEEQPQLVTSHNHTRPAPTQQSSAETHGRASGAAARHQASESPPKMRRTNVELARATSATGSNNSSTVEQQPVHPVRRIGAVGATSRFERLRIAMTSESVYRIVIVNLEPGRLGEVLSQGILERSAARGITSIRFSPTQELIVLGYGLRLDRDAPTEMHRIAALYRTSPGDDEIVFERSIEHADDDINIATFHPQVGYGIFYGTRQGSLRNYGFGRTPDNV